MGWLVNTTPRQLYPGKDAVPIVKEAGWVPGTVWTGAENLAQTLFDPRTVQPVASRRIDWAVPARKCLMNNVNLQRLKIFVPNMGSFVTRNCNERV